ncbi:MAG: hypothetical protein ACK4LT_06205 [Aquificaceae bacterium]
MGDFTKAGLDKGDLEKELEHMLLSAKIIYKSYLATIEDLTAQELSYDLEEYKDQLKKTIMPLVGRAEATKNKKLINMAYEIRYLYEKLIESIEKRLNNF